MSSENSQVKTGPSEAEQFFSDAPVRSLAREAYLHIKRMILAGALRMGDKISEKEIALSLGVSRTPIREALKQLELYGVVEFKPRSYAKVATISRIETLQLAQVRIELERLAIKCILADKDTLDPVPLMNAFERAVAAVDAGMLADAYLYDSAFHLELARQSRNPILHDTLERLDAKSQLVRVRAQTVPEQYKAQLLEHRHMVDLLRRNDHDEALSLIKTHITPRFWAARGFSTETQSLDSE